MSHFSSLGKAARHRASFLSSLDEEEDSSSSDESSASDWLSSSCLSSCRDSSSDSDQEPAAKRVSGMEDLRRPAYFVSTTSSIADFVDAVNKTSRCATEGCQGLLVPKRVETIGLGGGLRARFSCSGCTNRTIPFSSTVEVEHSRRTLVSLALQVASVLSGGGFALYQCMFGQCLGLKTVCSSSYASIIRLLHKPIKSLLDEQIGLALSDMRTMDPAELGSSVRAVTTGDECLLIRGSFSKNATFHVRNYMTNEVIAYKHLCQMAGPRD